MTVPPSSSSTPNPHDAPRLADSPPAPAQQQPPTQEPARSYVAGILTAGLAAVCGAVFTSWAGAQGTLAGAMIGATIGSGVSEVVRAPLTSLEQRIIRAGVSARRLRRDGLFKTILSSPTAAGAAGRELFSCLASRGAVPAIVTIAVVGFVLGIGGITAVEAAKGEPLSAIVADQPSTGTTLGQVIPNPPAVLAPADPSGSAAGQRGGGVTAEKPATAGDGASQPGAVPGASPAATGTASADKNGAMPSPAASPAASAQGEGMGSGTATPTVTVSRTPTTTATGTPATGTGTPATATGTPSPSGTVVQVVTVVVTATPTSTPGRTTGTERPAGSTPAAASTSGPAAVPTATATATPTPTPTSTTTQTPVAEPTILLPGLPQL